MDSDVLALAVYQQQDGKCRFDSTTRNEISKPIEASHKEQITHLFSVTCINRPRVLTLRMYNASCAPT